MKKYGISISELNPLFVDADTLSDGDLAVVMSFNDQAHVELIGQTLLQTSIGLVSLTDPGYELPSYGHWHIKVRKLAPKSVVTLVVAETPDTLDAEVRKLLKEGQFINAIKARRTATGEGLKEAKEYVEALRDREGL
jgi:hypothetical protein